MPFQVWKCASLSLCTFAIDLIQNLNGKATTKPQSSLFRLSHRVKHFQPRNPLKIRRIAREQKHRIPTNQLGENSSQVGRNKSASWYRKVS